MTVKPCSCSGTRCQPLSETCRAWGDLIRVVRPVLTRGEVPGENNRQEVLQQVLLELAATECPSVLRRIADELRLTADQKREAVALFLAELERRLPRFLAVVALTGLMPLIGERARKQFLAVGESPQNAEDLSQEVVARLLHAFYGNWPRGNAGALVATVCKHVLCDQQRRRQRTEKVLVRVRDERRAAGR